jgi:hypothetical protein
MDKVALLDGSERSALFGETGAARGVADTIIERDFWDCWTLKRLFELQNEEAPKGGTSLSKAFGAIRRFSEDIDLSFDRADLGYTGDRDPEKEGISRKQAGKLIDDLVRDVEKHVAEKLIPALRTEIAKHLGEPTDGEWSLEIDESDPQTVNFHYPTALPKEEYEGMAVSRCCSTPTTEKRPPPTSIFSSRSQGTKRCSSARAGRAMIGRGRGRCS